MLTQGRFSVCSFEGEEPKIASSHPDEVAFFPRQILITGGARAGKSRFALTLAKGGSFRQRLFVATAVACDGEMRRRIVRHKSARNGAWVTLEESWRLPEKIAKRWLSPGNLILVDCLPTFLTNLLLQGFSHAKIRNRIRQLLAFLRRPGVTSVFVTNEVGLGVVPDYPLGREFRDLLGEVNQKAASLCDEVYLLVAALPMRLK